MKKKIIIFIIIAFVAQMLSGCTDKSKQENEYVQMVTRAVNHNYAYDVEYGNAFDEFFSNSEWEYFNGIWESSDEDGDGEPDEIIDGVDVIEFTGSCQYRGVDVDVVIQFRLNLDEGVFSAEFLSLNDIPQNALTLSSLLDTVFTEYINNHPEKYEPENPDLYDENGVKDPETVDYICGIYSDIEGNGIRVEIVKTDDLHANVIMAYEGDESDYDFESVLEQGADGIFYLMAPEASIYLSSDGYLHVMDCEMSSYNSFYEKKE